MANIARDIFKAYDIRGIVGKTLTDEAAYLIGKAIATKASEKGITRIALGRDGRLSGPRPDGTNSTRFYRQWHRRPQCRHGCHSYALLRSHQRMRRQRRNDYRQPQSA